MRQSKDPGDLSELERLAEQPQLVAPIKYENHQREKQVFYDFVKRYGHTLGIEINIERLGYLEELIRNYQQLRSWAKVAGKVPDGLTNTFVYAAKVISGPVLYPVFGGSVSDIERSSIVTIRLPTYYGLRRLLISDPRIHEYFHAYHIILARDLKHRRLITADGYAGVPREKITPILLRAPTFERVKKFEKDVISEIIKLEKRRRGLGKQQLENEISSL